MSRHSLKTVRGHISPRSPRGVGTGVASPWRELRSQRSAVISYAAFPAGVLL